MAHSDCHPCGSCGSCGFAAELHSLSSRLWPVGEAFAGSKLGKESDQLRSKREEAFWQRHARAMYQNSLPGARWWAAASHLFDALDDELKVMRGYKPVAPVAHAAKALNFLQITTDSADRSNTSAAWDIPQGLVLPEAMDWRPKVSTSNEVRSQGVCGDCWAISSLNALEMHLELGHRGEPSMVGRVGGDTLDELVTCTPNRHHCGGSGGCGGATSELAFQYVKEHGLSLKDWSQASKSSSGSLCSHAAGQRRLVSDGFVRLSPNVAYPLQYALSTQGPVVVSADASNWETYGGGIFDGCGRNAAVNHAVLAVGYGRSPQGKYWIIRNSWGREWGESGHMRLLRFEDEKVHCGMDYHPQEGVGCDGETTPVPVCGMCGILFDSAFPVNVRVA
ncbi:unnamed protein product [Durusdinium trenchii]|uniref:Peptidase C1A papain C-terminal domain-containing protein n=1 Tax=Durusdinium trenchii TaxID=1381693 RepID=A0ABP0SBU9_9DINO